MGEEAKQDVQTHGIELYVVKHTQAKCGVVLLPRCWVVERSFAWAARFRRLAQTLPAFHYLAFACLMLHKVIPLVETS